MTRARVRLPRSHAWAAALLKALLQARSRAGVASPHARLSLTVLLTAVVPALLIALPPSATAQVGASPSSREGDSYRRMKPSPDGTGIVYLGRETADVMDAVGAAWLERPERAGEERPDLLLEALDLKAGMRVADVGAGTGYYSRRLAQDVGPTGRVLAVDVQPRMLELLAAEMKRRGIRNVEGVLGTSTDPRLPADSVDLVLMVDVYHEFDHPKEMLAGLVRALKRDGRIVFVEYRAEDAAVPISPHHKMSEAQVRREAQAAGLVWQQTVETLPWQHVVIFRKPG